MLRVLSIIEDSIVDGEGLRTTIFFSGCPHQCQGCHNPESWDYRNGKDYSLDELASIILSNPINDVTFSGGEPFLQAKQLVPLAKILKRAGKNIWVYTGYTLEQIIAQRNDDAITLLKEIDVLVDGPFIKSQRNLSLDFRGSSNQNIISLNGKSISIC